jgi:hypothetical protein
VNQFPLESPLSTLCLNLLLLCSSVAGSEMRASSRHAVIGANLQLTSLVEKCSVLLCLFWIESPSVSCTVISAGS